MIRLSSVDKLIVKNKEKMKKKIIHSNPKHKYLTRQQKNINKDKLNVSNIKIKQEDVPNITHSDNFKLLTNNKLSTSKESHIISTPRKTKINWRECFTERRRSRRLSNLPPEDNIKVEIKCENYDESYDNIPYNLSSTETVKKEIIDDTYLDCLKQNEWKPIMKIPSNENNEHESFDKVLFNEFLDENNKINKDSKLVSMISQNECLENNLIQTNSCNITEKSVILGNVSSPKHSISEQIYTCDFKNNFDTENDILKTNYCNVIENYVIEKNESNKYNVTKSSVKLENKLNVVTASSKQINTCDYTNLDNNIKTNEINNTDACDNEKPVSKNFNPIILECWSFKTSERQVYSKQIELLSLEKTEPNQQFLPETYSKNTTMNEHNLLKSDHEIGIKNKPELLKTKSEYIEVNNLALSKICPEDTIINIQSAPIIEVNNSELQNTCSGETIKNEQSVPITESEIIEVNNPALQKTCPRETIKNEQSVPITESEIIEINKPALQKTCPGETIKNEQSVPITESEIIEVNNPALQKTCSEEAIKNLQSVQINESEIIEVNNPVLQNKCHGETIKNLQSVPITKSEIIEVNNLELQKTYPRETIKNVQSVPITESAIIEVNNLALQKICPEETITNPHSEPKINSDMTIMNNTLLPEIQKPYSEMTIEEKKSYREKLKYVTALGLLPKERLSSLSLTSKDSSDSKLKPRTNEDYTEKTYYRTSSEKIRHSYFLEYSNDNDQKKHTAIPILIPEKTLGSSFHPSRMCMHKCCSCHGKFGLLDTPCHIAQIKNLEKQKMCLENVSHLIGPNSCLCTACFRAMEKRSNQKYIQKKACIVMTCRRTATHSFESPWLDKIKQCLLNRKEVILRPWANKVETMPICDVHHNQVLYISQCQLCGNRTNQKFEINKAKACEFQKILDKDKILVKIDHDLLICKTCHFYLSSRTCIKQVPEDVVKHRNTIMNRIYVENKLDLPPCIKEEIKSVDEEQTVIQIPKIENCFATDKSVQPIEKKDIKVVSSSSSQLTPKNGINLIPNSSTQINKIKNYNLSGLSTQTTQNEGVNLSVSATQPPQNKSIHFVPVSYLRPIKNRTSVSDVLKCSTTSSSLILKPTGVTVTTTPPSNVPKITATVLPQQQSVVLPKNNKPTPKIIKQVIPSGPKFSCHPKPPIFVPVLKRINIPELIKTKRLKMTSNTLPLIKSGLSSQIFPMTKINQRKVGHNKVQVSISTMRLLKELQKPYLTSMKLFNHLLQLEKFRRAGELVLANHITNSFCSNNKLSQSITVTPNKIHNFPKYKPNKCQPILRTDNGNDKKLVSMKSCKNIKINSVFDNKNVYCSTGNVKKPIMINNGIAIKNCKKLIAQNNSNTEFIKKPRIILPKPKFYKPLKYKNINNEYKKLFISPTDSTSNIKTEKLNTTAFNYNSKTATSHTDVNIKPSDINNVASTTKKNTNITINTISNMHIKVSNSISVAVKPITTTNNNSIKAISGSPTYVKFISGNPNYGQFIVNNSNLKNMGVNRNVSFDTPKSSLGLPINISLKSTTLQQTSTTGLSTKTLKLVNTKQLTADELRMAVINGTPLWKKGA